MKPTDRRKRLIAALHVAKAKAALDDDTYRAVLRNHCSFADGQTPSSKAMSAYEILSALNDICARAGIQRPRHHGRPSVTPERSAQIKKIEAMLADKGRRQGRSVPWAYADAMAKKLCGVDKVAWCSPEQLNKLIAALSYDQHRMDARGGAA